MSLDPSTSRPMRTATTIVACLALAPISFRAGAALRTHIDTGPSATTEVLTDVLGDVGPAGTTPRPLDVAPADVAPVTSETDGPVEFVETMAEREAEGGPEAPTGGTAIPIQTGAAAPSDSGTGSEPAAGDDHHVDDSVAQTDGTSPVIEPASAPADDPPPPEPEPETAPETVDNGPADGGDPDGTDNDNGDTETTVCLVDTQPLTPGCQGQDPTQLPPIEIPDDGSDDQDPTDGNTGDGGNDDESEPAATDDGSICLIDSNPLVPGCQGEDITAIPKPILPEPENCFVVRWPNTICM